MDRPDLKNRAGHAWRHAATGLRRGASRAGTGLRRLPWFRAIALGGLSLALLLFASVLVLIPLTPSVQGVLKARDDKPSVLLAADGSELATFRKTHREWIALNQVPAHVVDALISTEDHRFHEHNGIDWWRSVAAVGHTLLGDRQGGSTLTQQLARNLFPKDIGRAPTATRKLKEMITAVKLDAAYSKRELLEAYLNTVPFLYNAFGIEMAARTYFSKPASRLSVAEGATLVGMLKGTYLYNPVSNPERAAARRNVVLAQMVRHGKLSRVSYERLSRQPLRLRFKRQDLAVGPAPHFADAVRRWLVEWAGPLGYDVFADGLVVRSTLDPRLQRLANRAVARQLDALQAVADVEWGRASGRLLSTGTASYVQARRSTEPFAHFWAQHPELLEAFVRESPEYAALLDAGIARADALERLLGDVDFMLGLRARKTRLEAGFVAIDPSTGFVRAWVGSRDHATDSFDHVQQARRQPGSTFKPFVYGAALEAGMDPRREFRNRNVAIRLPGDQAAWKPRDATDAGGEVANLEDGLIHSRNAVTAQVIAEVGVAPVARFAQRMGVRDSRLEAVPSLALGTSPVTLLEMATAYATLAALGEHRPPVLVTQVSDANGNVLARFAPDSGVAPERVAEPDVALQLVDMLRGAVDRGTGRGIREVHAIQADVGGKTGTTQNGADGWFILLHPRLVAGAWVGFNDPRVTLRSDYWGQGAHTALPVVGDFMRQALDEGAVDARATFPSRMGVGVQAVLKRFGEKLRSLFGFGSE